jgi:hypothetical protein
MYHRSLDVLGTPTFIVSDGVGAISLDGSVGLSLPTDPRTESFDEETIDIRVRVRTLPPDGGRYGLVDRNGASSMFLYGDGRLTCRGQIAYAYSPDATAGHFQRLTCVVARNGTAALYVQGARVAEGDADAPVVRAGERTMIGRDDLDNDASVIADPLQGDIATVRLYHRALTEKEIAPR